ncbi:TRM11 family SAM-dependent methyltransferase [Vulcanisaeta moutnovskia]|uniref:TRM11 family SAM-dependent methyltransferase n=1 Tax=Vulcanisaeta moutnovskia TaxID=985052 RepID=UPI0009FE79AA|nr:DNA methyltransferase [Vulcanisaeta moutnovskia]
MVRLRVEVSRDLKALAYGELESLCELSDGSLDLIDDTKDLIINYKGSLESLKRRFCRAALIRRAWVIDDTNETLFAELDRSRYRTLKRGRKDNIVSIDLRIARLLVNLARTNENEVFLDPFVGSGIIAQEAMLVGAHVIGIDTNPRYLSMVGSGVYTDSINSDSLLSPIKDNSIHSIATDPPYNRLSISNIDLDSFYRKFAEESFRILRRGGYIAFSHPTYVDSLDWFLNLGFELVISGLQYVHGGLTRLIYVFRKP